MIGFGYDVHRLQEGESLVLGGVSLESKLGTVAHSDGDVLLHAIMDALLGACALGDIGLHFPDTKPEYRGADSIELLKHVVTLVAAEGMRIVNIDSTVNGGVVADYDWPGSLFSLSNGTDEIDLYNGTTLIDKVGWDNGATFPDPVGASMMLKTTKLTSANNDLGANWCTSTSFIDSDSTLDLGTPGVKNDAC